MLFHFINGLDWNERLGKLSMGIIKATFCLGKSNTEEGYVLLSEE